MSFIYMEIPIVSKELAKEILDKADELDLTSAVALIQKEVPKFSQYYTLIQLADDIVYFGENYSTKKLEINPYRSESKHNNKLVSELPTKIEYVERPTGIDRTLFLDSLSAITNGKSVSNA